MTYTLLPPALMVAFVLALALAADAAVSRPRTWLSTLAALVSLVAAILTFGTLLVITWADRP